MQKIIVLNPKGGSGKTTLATNLASYFAVQGLSPVLMDMDAQGSSTRWLSKRTMEQQPIHGIAAYENNSRVTRSFALRIPQHCQRVVIDTPAAFDKQAMPELTRDAHAIIVPVLPSDIDIHAAAKCITNLLLVAKVSRESQRIGVIANRVKMNTVMYRSLMRFLGSLDIPILTSLRDSQNYIRAAEAGVGIFEMKPGQVREDLDQWLPVIGWLAQREGVDPSTWTSTLPSLSPTEMQTGIAQLKATPVAQTITSAQVMPAIEAALEVAAIEPLAAETPAFLRTQPIEPPFLPTESEQDLEPVMAESPTLIMPSSHQPATASPIASIAKFFKRKR